MRILSIANYTELELVDSKYLHYRRFVRRRQRTSCVWRPLQFIFCTKTLRYSSDLFNNNKNIVTYDNRARRCRRCSPICRRTCTFLVCTVWGRHIWTVSMNRWLADSLLRLGCRNSRCHRHTPTSAGYSARTGDKWTETDSRRLSSIHCFIWWYYFISSRISSATRDR